MSPGTSLTWSDAAVVSFLLLALVLAVLRFDGLPAVVATVGVLVVAAVWYVDRWFRSYLDGEPRGREARVSDSD